MTVAVCVDDRGGMLFNKRRVSRDRVVTADILGLALSEGKKLCINSFSEKLFEESMENVAVLEDISESGEDAVCFVENVSLAAMEEKIHRLVIYRWNRAYPGDFFLDIKTDASWKLIAAEEFAGYSHEKITKEIYVK